MTLAHNDDVGAPDSLNRRVRDRFDPLLNLLAVAAVVGGALAGIGPQAVVVAVAAVIVLAVVLAVAVRPRTAAYLWLGVTPLVVGIERGSLVPLLRPNEALLLLLVLGLAARSAVRWARGGRTRMAVSSVDVGFGLLALTGSALPLLWTVARGRTVTAEDVFSAANVTKYFLVYLIVRAAIASGRDIRRCLMVSMSSGAVVAVLAILQALGMFGVPELLATLWTPFGGSGRGSSTIGQAQGLADVMVFNLAITAALVLREGASRWLLGLSALFLVGALASGQVSGVIGLVVGVLAVGYALRRLRTVLLGFLLATPVAVVGLAPVVAARLASVDPRTGVPTSWDGRWRNLTTYFWPRLFDEDNWLLGVQLVPEAQGREVWQPVVWIESGHTWLLWIGGVPFLLAFVVFAFLALRLSLHVTRTGSGPALVAGAATFAAWWTVTIGMVFDPHLLMRGSADLSFPLLALTVAGAALRRVEVGTAATGHEGRSGLSSRQGSTARLGTSPKAAPLSSEKEHSHQCLAGQAAGGASEVGGA